MTLEIYTDGASSPNTHKAGGWGVAFVRGGEVTLTLSGGALDTTNNIMEMTAVLKAMEMLRKYESRLDKSEQITIISDSQYVLKGLTEWHKGWEKRNWKTVGGDAVKNKELWQTMLKLKSCLVDVYKLPIDFQWVRGHNGNTFNDLADELAVEAKHTIAEENGL